MPPRPSSRVSSGNQESRTDPAIGLLERRIRAKPDDHLARYQLAILLLAPDLYNYYYRKSAVLRQARAQITRAVALQPRKSAYHALLGFVDTHRANTHTQALESLRTALHLKPNDRVLQVYVPALLAEMGHEREAIREIERAASLQRVDLRSHRAALKKAGMPASADNLLQAFLRPRNYFTSDLARLEERIRKTLRPAAHRKAVRAVRDDCRRRQREMRASFERARVPEHLRVLAVAASRYGIGDDGCRPLLMKRMSRQSRATLMRNARKLARPVQEWLDGFAPGEMSDEAAAYMYLFEGIEERD